MHVILALLELRKKIVKRVTFLLPPSSKEKGKIGEKIVSGLLRASAGC